MPSMAVTFRPRFMQRINRLFELVIMSELKFSGSVLGARSGFFWDEFSKGETNIMEQKLCLNSIKNI